MVFSAIEKMPNEIGEYRHPGESIFLQDKHIYIIKYGPSHSGG